MLKMSLGRLRLAPAWLKLAGLGASSAVVVWLGLAQPYSVFELQLVPLRNIARLTRAEPLAQAGFVLTLATLSGLYYLAWRVCRDAGRTAASRRPVWAALGASLLAMNLLMVWLYPVGAADVFDNIARGRITALHGGNPFYDTPRDYPLDRFRYFVGWPDATTAYGPLWELLAAGASRVAGDGKLANVLVFKGLGLLFYAGSLGLIAVMLRRQAPARALQGVCLFAWNPLVVYETAGNGHNDIALVFFILLALWALQRRWGVMAVAALVGGALIKFIPALLLPLVVVYGLRAATSWRARLSFLGLSALASAALVLVSLAPFWRGGDVFALERRTRLFTTSIPAIVQVQLEPLLGLKPSQQVAASLAALALLGAVFRDTWRVWGDPRWPAVVRAAAHVLLFYLLFACLWFQPWYTVWPLALAALLPEGGLGRTVVLLSYAAAWKAIIFDYFLYTGGPLPPLAWRETVLGPATLGLIWLYLAYRLARREWQRRILIPARPLTPVIESSA